MSTFYGRRVFAIDGSTYRVPNTPEMADYFGSMKSGGQETAIARFSLCYDVLNKITYDAILGNYHTGEQDLARDHLEMAAIPPKSLILMDRGYGSFLLLKQILDDGHDFLVRVKSNWKVAKQLKASKKKDGIFPFYPSRDAKKELEDGGHSTKPIMVRMVSIDVGVGEPYILMTNIVDEPISLQELGDLYHDRWQVEESYKAKKTRLMMEEVSGMTPEIVLQDFHAQIFSECLTEALVLETNGDIANYNRGKKRNYMVCMAQAYAKMKNAFVLLFVRENPMALVIDLLKIFTQNLTAIVPGRKSKRSPSGKTTLKYNLPHRAYKRNR